MKKVKINGKTYLVPPHVVEWATHKKRRGWPNGYVAAIDVWNLRLA